MATRNATVRVIILCELKEMRQKEKPVVNLVTPVAQALQMAKSELKQKGENSIIDGVRKTATSDWNSLRY